MADGGMKLRFKRRGVGNVSYRSGLGRGAQRRRRLRRSALGHARIPGRDRELVSLDLRAARRLLGGEARGTVHAQ
jgi:hypothetical protein